MVLNDESCCEKDPMERDCWNCPEREWCDWCPDEDFDVFVDEEEDCYEEDF